jgi:hypothetical protein
VLSVGFLAQVVGTGMASAATAVADYRFLNSRLTSAGTGPALTDVKSTNCGTKNPANKFTTASVGGRTIPVLSFPKDNGLQLKPSRGVVGTSYTIVVLFEFASDTLWRRIIDFSNSATDTGLYVDPSGDLSFYPYATGTDPIAAGTWVQVVLTRAAGSKKLIGYLNGTKEFTYVDTPGAGVPDAKSTIFFHDNTTGGATCESSAGEVARIEIYHSALSASVVKALPLLPDEQAISLSSSSVAAGSSVTVTGSNYGPSEVVTLSFKDSGGTTFTLGTVTTAVDGSFSQVVTIPSSAATGVGTVSATGGTSQLSASKDLTVT